MLALLLGAGTSQAQSYTSTTNTAAVPTVRFEVTPDTTPIAVGATADQKITIKDVGPYTGNATNVTVTYKPPKTQGITVNSVKLGNNICTLGTDGYVCPSLPTMAYNATVNLTVNMTVAPGTPVGTAAGSETIVNSTEFNPGNGTGESLFKVWGAWDPSAAQNDAFWFGFAGNYNSGIADPSEEGDPFSSVWGPTQANPPGAYNFRGSDSTAYSFYTHPTQGIQPYGTTRTYTSSPRTPKFQRIVDTSPSLQLPEIYGPYDPSTGKYPTRYVARDNRRVWEVRTGVYLNQDSPLFVCASNPDDAMYVAIDNNVVVETTRWNVAISNTSGGSYGKGYHEIVYRIANRNNQYTAFENGPGGFASLGIGTTSTSDCSQEMYNTLTRVGPSSNPVIAAPNLTISKTNGVTQVTSGRQTTYTLTVTNTGTAPTSGPITVRDLLGPGLTFASVSSASGAVQGGTAGSTGEQTFTLTPTAPIPVGGTVTLAVTVNVTATSGNVLNRATVGGGGTPDPLDPSQCATTVAGATPQCAVDSDGVTVPSPPPKPPALKITKTVNAPYLKVNPDYNTATADRLPLAQIAPQQLVYTLTVENTGTGPAQNLTIKDVLPPVLRYSSVRARSGTAGNYGAWDVPVTAQADTPAAGQPQNITFDLGTTSIPVGGAVQLEVTTTLPTGADGKTLLPSNTNQAPLVNNAEITKANYTLTPNDPNLKSSATTDVIYPKITKRVANLGKDGTVAPVYGTTAVGNPKDILQYCLDFHNYSSVDLKNWTLTDAVPLNSSYQVAGNQTLTAPAQAPAGAYPGATYAATQTGGANGKGQITYTIPNLPAGTSDSLCFRVTID